MNKTQRLLGLVIAVVFAATIAGCSTGDKTVAIVNGEEIKKSQLDRRVEKVKQQFASTGIKYDTKEGKEMIKSWEQKELDKLVDEHILYQEAEKQKVLPSDAEVNTKVQETKKKFGTEEEFAKIIKDYNMDEDDFKSWIKMGMAQDALYNKITKDVVVKPEDIKKYYDENTAMFEEKEKVRARHILVRFDTPENTVGDKVYRNEEEARKIANDLLVKINTGGDFAKLAKESSEDPGSKDTGGEYTFGRGQMVKEFEDAAFALKPGQVTKEPVKTMYGFHIIKLEEKIPAKKRTFDEVKKELEQKLPSERKQQVFIEFFNKVKESAVIEWKIERVATPPSGMGMPGGSGGAGGGDAGGAQGQKPPGHP
ncbi:MAG: peptidylprolyl isomerase [Clostridia bacterium]|nr:peptidylprolyl isomerase [Clostridia bacterium]